MRRPGSRGVRDIFVLIATASVLLVGCGSGEGATSVKAGQQAPTGGLPATTAPELDEGPSRTVVPAPGAVNVPVSPTIPELPRDGPEPPPIPDIEPIESQLQNNNVRDGGLGSLCWARWEINRQIRVGASSVDESEAQAAVATLRDELPILESELGALMSQLPSELHPFLARLRADVGLATGLVQNQGDAQVAAEAFGRQFDFDSYPGVDQYRLLAAKHAACRHL